MQSINVKQLGEVDYMTVWSAMKEFVAQNQNRADEIWVCEHPKVFTLGLAGDLNHVLCPGNIPVIKTDRGGEVTYHGPGQIVIYLMIDIHRKKIFPKRFLWKIEEAVINTLSSFSIASFRIPGAPGIYIQGQDNSGPFDGAKKICSIGIKISRGMTYHGLALNFDTDLDDFKRINPCGYQGLKLVNFADLAPNVTREQLVAKLVENLMEQLN